MFGTLPGHESNAETFQILEEVAELKGMGDPNSAEEARLKLLDNKLKNDRQVRFSQFPIADLCCRCRGLMAPKVLVLRGGWHWTCHCGHGGKGGGDCNEHFKDRT